MKRRNKKSRGFTLIETLVGLTIVVILAAMSVPIIHNTVGYIRLNAAVTAISGAISSTRYEAIMHGYPYQITFNSGNFTYQVASQPTSGGAFGNIGNPVTLPNETGMTLSASPNFQFNPNGTVQPAGTSFSLTYNGTTKTISVSGVGRVQVQ